MLKNKIFTIILMVLLVSPVVAEPENIQNVEGLTNISQEMPAEQSENVKVEEALPQMPESITYKQPVSRKQMAKKFLLAMAGVGISSILLFVVLTLYNKVREIMGISGGDVSSEDENSLETPDNLEDAVRTFLDKTKWDN